MVMPLDFVSDLINFIVNGTIVGLPTIAVMAIPFIVGLIAGYLVKKLLKIAIILGVLVFILSYFGIWGLSIDRLTDWATTYGALAVQGAILMIGILPLGIGFIVGLILGFIFG
jgi:uncharacterized membrane protein (Fun14 family)